MYIMVELNGSIMPPDEDCCGSGGAAGNGLFIGFMGGATAAAGKDAVAETGVNHFPAFCLDFPILDKYRDFYNEKDANRFTSAIQKNTTSKPTIASPGLYAARPNTAIPARKRAKGCNARSFESPGYGFLKSKDMYNNAPTTKIDTSIS
jgi:hypothetical protein